MWYNKEGSDLVVGEEESKMEEEMCQSNSLLLPKERFCLPDLRFGSTSSSCPPALALSAVSGRQFSSLNHSKNSLSSFSGFFFPYSLSLPFLPQLSLFSARAPGLARARGFPRNGDSGRWMRDCCLPEQEDWVGPS